MKNLINSIRENFDIFKNIIKLADKKYSLFFILRVNIIKNTIIF